MQEERNHPVTVNTRVRFFSPLVFFHFFWRASLLALPWQTRWFRDASLAGWPWEQGRISVYASWGLMIATILCWRLTTLVDEAPTHRSAFRSTTYAALLLVALTLLRTSSLTATLQWWFQIFLLVAFVRTLVAAKLSWSEIATWFVVSLLPHVALGVWQYAAQEVVALKWLGIAAKFPQDFGVSVVEAGPFRILRASGGFPHPNLFGGWLVIGLVTSFLLARDALSKSRAVLWSLAAVAISTALFLTYARGAWIAAVVGVVILAMRFHRSQFFRVACLSALLATGIISFSQRNFLFSRLYPTERLEVKSIDVRLQSLKNGWQLFRASPWFGTGPNAELKVMKTREHENTRTREPLEPPHSAFLLALADVGVVGILLLGFMYLGWRKQQVASSRQHAACSRQQGIQSDTKPPAPSSQLPATPLSSFFLIPLAILALFDHYLWSLWAGQALAAITLLLLFLEHRRETPRNDTPMDSPLMRVEV